MALTKISRSLLDTGVSDSSDATAITIDSSENVGIGVTPSTIWSTSYDALQIGIGGSISAHSSAGDALKIGSNFVYEGTAPNYYDKYLTTSTAHKYELDADGHKWFYAASGTAGNAISWSEAMRITSSGVVDIKSGGSSSTPSLIFEGDTDTGFFHGTNVLAIATAGSERARIDDSGYFMVGKTSAAAAAGAGVTLDPSGATFYTLNTSSDANTLHVYDQVDSAYRFYVRATGSSAGTIFATVQAIASASDERLKENIKDLETGLTEIMALKPRRFDWKEGEGNGTKNNAGFIAQEVEPILPDLVGAY